MSIVHIIRYPSAGYSVTFHNAIIPGEIIITGV